MKWDIVYKRAVNDDGSLFFPERLTDEFLQDARKRMGSYFYANQYENIVIPEDERRFKSEWLRYYHKIPPGGTSFAFIDPAIGQKDHHDYTGIAVIQVYPDGNWYLRVAKRERLTPTEIVDKIFELHKHFNCQVIGIEVVAYQEALLYILDEKMRQRNVVLPVKGIMRNNVSKATRILGLVPRFEWGRIYVSQGMTDFEDEYFTFPRGKFDDILDAIASLEEIVTYPEENMNEDRKPPSPNHPDYEAWYIRQLAKQQHQED